MDNTDPNGPQRLTKYITAVSLNPLPSGPEIRQIVEDYMDRIGRPSDLLRELADELDRYERTLNRLPPDFAAPREASTYLYDYKDHANRRTYRCTADHVRRLDALGRVTGLDRTALIRAALAAHNKAQSR